MGPDVEDHDEQAVDTDSDLSLADSGDSTEGEEVGWSDGEDDIIHKPLPATGGPSATGDLTTKQLFKHGNVFDNGYFYLHQGDTSCRMYIHEKWRMTPPLGLGRAPTMSKSVTLSQIGDVSGKPVRTTMLLRAWMIWRVRQHPDWLRCSESRTRLFTEEADRLLADVKNIQPQCDGLLGHDTGSAMFRTWVPEVIARMVES